MVSGLGLFEVVVTARRSSERDGRWAELHCIMIQREEKLCQVPCPEVEPGTFRL